jgi:hypothetical protein
MPTAAGPVCSADAGTRDITAGNCQKEPPIANNPDGIHAWARQDRRYPTSSPVAT